jgi:hypothetical protein
LVFKYGKAHLMAAQREVGCANSADGAWGVADDSDSGHGYVIFSE